MTDALARLREAADKATKGPRVWSFLSDKGNGYVVGQAWRDDGAALSGHVSEDVICDEPLLRLRLIGECEAATVNYADAALIALCSPETILALVACIKAAQNVKVWWTKDGREWCIDCGTSKQSVIGHLAECTVGTMLRTLARLDALP